MILLVIASLFFCHVLNNVQVVGVPTDGVPNGTEFFGGKSDHRSGRCPGGRVCRLWYSKGRAVTGGKTSQASTNLWIASIQSGGECGGSILSSTTILTAAHCVEGPRDSYIVRVGSSGTDCGVSWHRVAAIRRHEAFNVTADHFMNDVALVKVSPPINLGRHATPIHLASEGYTTSPNANARLVGWGSTSEGGGMSYELRSAWLYVVESDECARAYGDETGTAMKFRNLICAHGFRTGSCHGDSGGPLVIEGDIQIGIVFGARNCADNRYPGIYQDVAHYRHRIDENLKYL